MDSQRSTARSLRYWPHPDSRDLLVACSGRNMGFRQDAFSFTRSIKGLDVNCLQIRDNFGLWYHAGLEGRTRGIVDTALYLAEFVAARDFARVSMIGVSAGGYAALLHGELIGADAICAIAPRTRLYPDAEHHADVDRHGVRSSLAELARRPEREENFFDLAGYFRANPIETPEVRVHYDPEHGLDAFHAKNLAGLPGVELVTHPGAGHTLARDLLADPDFLPRVAFGGSRSAPVLSRPRRPGRPRT